MPTEQVFIGLTTTGLCAAGLAHESWFLTQTKKGRRLVDACGTHAAGWILRCLFAIGVLFGLALAVGVVNPIRWSTSWNSTLPERSTEAQIVFAR